MTSRRAALIVDAKPEVAALVSSVFLSDEWTVTNVPTNRAALFAVQASRFDIVLTSENTCAQEDVDLLCRIRRVNAHTRVIILVGDGTPADVIAAMREHAFSYLRLPAGLEPLKEILQIAMEAPAWDDGIELRSITSAWIRLSARCDSTTADRLVQFVNEISEELPMKERLDMGTAFREMLLNAMEHGGHFDPETSVEISYLRSARAVSCRIRDPGQGFSLQEIPHAAISNPLEAPFQHLSNREEQGLRPGGFGILLTQKLVDELIYNEKGNEVILIKHLDNPNTPTDEV